MSVYIKMATILLGVCLCSSFVSSAAAGMYSSGSIPRTGPHYLKLIEADKMKEAIVPLLGDLSAYKNNFIKPGTVWETKEGVTNAEVKAFIDSIDKAKCEKYYTVGSDTQTLIQAAREQTSGDLFSLEGLGMTPKEKVIYAYLNITKDEDEILKTICTERLKTN